MRKTGIEVKADLAVRIDVYKMAQLQVEDERDNLFDVADNEKESEIDFWNMGLIEFVIQTQTSLADNIRKTCCK